MSTPATYAEATAQPVAVAPSTSTALVPIVSDHGPRLASAAATPVNAHHLFYGMGYAGLVLIWISMWIEAVGGAGMDVFAGMGVMFVGVGGFGAFIHTIYKPNERKVRHLLLAIASLTLTMVAYPLVERITREMYASRAVSRLGPLAEALSKDARIRNVGVFNASAMLNGYIGPEYGVGSIDREEGVTLDDVLTRDGIRREEYLAYQRSLRAMGMERAQRTASTVAFLPDGPSGLWLLYVAPGHALPPAHALLEDSGTYHSQPLGGPWYMVLHGRR